jgi:hypothetical protein
MYQTLRMLRAVLLVFGSVVVASSIASACRETVDGPTVCATCQYGGIPTTRCAFSLCGVADFCFTGYGECSCTHKQYSSSFAYGEDCENYCGDSPVTRKLNNVPLREGEGSDPKAIVSAARFDQPLARLVLVPSRCLGSYIVIDPEESKVRQQGGGI